MRMFRTEDGEQFLLSGPAELVYTGSLTLKPCSLIERAVHGHIEIVAARSDEYSRTATLASWSKSQCATKSRSS